MASCASSTWQRAARPGTPSLTSGSMHHSDKVSKQVVAATCYLDESATDGATPTAVVGGLVLDRTNFLRLNTKWNRMLNKFNLHPSIHMKDFGKDGRFGSMPEDVRRRILSRASKIIIDHNIFTIAATLEHADYRNVFPKDFNDKLSQYALCFLACVLGNHKIATHNNYTDPAGFVVDAGTQYSSQIVAAHRELYQNQESGGHSVSLGSLTIADDKRVTALQAADVVCWAVRRQATSYPFNNGFEPVEEILKQK